MQMHGQPPPSRPDLSIVVRLRRRTRVRSRNHEKPTVAIVLGFGVLITPTAFGQTVLDAVGKLVQGVTQSASP